MFELIPFATILYLAFRPKPKVFEERIAQMKSLADPSIGKTLNVTSIADIAKVLSSIKYKPDLIDTTNPPSKTIQLGYGDCDDFAVLSYSLLLHLNKNPGIAIAYNPDDPEAHAFTFFYCPECNEYYIFSNNDIFPATSIEEAANMLGYSKVIYSLEGGGNKNVYITTSCCSP